MKRGEDGENKKEREEKKIKSLKEEKRLSYVSGNNAVVIFWGISSSVVHTSQHVHTHPPTHRPTQWTAVESNVLSDCRLYHNKQFLWPADRSWGS